MDVNVPLKRLMNEDNVLDKIAELDTRTSPENADYVDSSDDLSLRTGLQVVDELIAPAPDVEVLDPEDPTFYGAGVTGGGRTFGSLIMNFWTVAAGKLSVGFNTLGQFLAAFGNLIIDFRGIFLNDSYILAQLEAFSGGVDNYDEVYYGGFYTFAITDGANGLMVFGQINMIQGGNNLLSNGDFASGDFTSWTQTGTPVIVSDSPNGTYCAKVSTANYITQNVTTTTGVDYLLTFYVRKGEASSSANYPFLYIDGSLSSLKIGSPAASETTNWIKAVAIFRATDSSTEIKIRSSDTDYMQFTNFDCRLLDSWSFNGDVDTDHMGNLRLVSPRNITIQATPSTAFPQTQVHIRNPIRLPEVTTPNSDGSAAGNMGTAWPEADYNNLYFKSNERLHSQNTSGTEVGYLVNDGWTPVADTWEYASASTITIPSDGTTTYQKGDYLRLKQGGGYKYYTIASLTSTVITVIVNTDYTVANAAITDIGYSRVANPQGWPGVFNYAAAPTGFSAAPTNAVYQYRTFGTRCKVDYRDGTVGTSNATTFTASAPVVPASITNMAWGSMIWNATDNGVVTTTTGRVSLVAGNSTMTLRTNTATGAWTAANGKAANFSVEFDF